MFCCCFLEKKPEIFILHFGTNDALYKSCANILKDLIKLKDFILGKLPSCKKVKLSSYTVHPDKEIAKKNNETD